MGFSAVLDTCVLWQSLQRDFLLSLAAEGLYRPLWSSAILDELSYHEARKLEKRGTPHQEALARTARLVRTMSDAFSGALVQGWEPLEGSYGLSDPDDEHVVAAAVVGGAGAIVTDNLKHLRVPQVPGHIQVISAKGFAADTVDLNPSVAARAIVQISARQQNPPHTPHQLLELLGLRYGMTDVVEIVGSEL